MLCVVCVVLFNEGEKRQRTLRFALLGRNIGLEGLQGLSVERGEPMALKPLQQPIGFADKTIRQHGLQS